MQQLTLKQIIFFSILLIIAILGLTAWLASLVLPDWEFYIQFPFWHNVVAWVIFGIIAFFVILILYAIVDLAIDTHILERQKADLQREKAENLSKIAELEAELNEIKRRP